MKDVEAPRLLAAFVFCELPRVALMLDLVGENRTKGCCQSRVALRKEPHVRFELAPPPSLAAMYESEEDVFAEVAKELGVRPWKIGKRLAPCLPGPVQKDSRMARFVFGVPKVERGALRTLRSRRCIAEFKGAFGFRGGEGEESTPSSAGQSPGPRVEHVGQPGA